MSSVWKIKKFNELKDNNLIHSGDLNDERREINDEFFIQVHSILCFVTNKYYNEVWRFPYIQSVVDVQSQHATATFWHVRWIDIAISRTDYNCACALTVPMSWNTSSHISWHSKLLLFQSVCCSHLIYLGDSVSADNFDSAICSRLVLSFSLLRLLIVQEKLGRGPLLRKRHPVFVVLLTWSKRRRHLPLCC